MIYVSKWKLFESSMIKSIRRGLVDDAIYWAGCIYRSEKEENIWRRLFIHLSEDIGLAEPNLPANIKALHENYLTLKHNDKAAYEGDESHLLPLVHAVMLMAESKKSRAVDNAITVHFRKPFTEKEIPDYAIDFHSPMGRKMGRNINHYLDIASQLANDGGVHDPWKSDARRKLKKFWTSTDK